MIEYPRSGSEKIFEKSSYGIIRRITPIPRHLPVVENLLVLTQDFPRFFRYSMGSRMVDLTLDMLSLIYKANSSYEKVGVLTEFLDRYRMLQMLFRVCVEQKVIAERKYASFGLLLEKIGKQATS
ncbi:four helix bundle protein [Bacteroides thetaiotaomicron]|uniref:four helix bundle protein n=1 Tax=Bacteroides thetaiotaomicron TaxID=818 RepID=UPI001CE2D7A2|nr:four helix bundle protein [Bacteroides thetaiotaomicron]